MQREQFAQLTQGKTLTPQQQAEIQQIQAKTSEIVRQSLAWSRCARSIWTCTARPSTTTTSRR